METAELVDRVRAAHRRFPSGVAVVTTSVEGVPYGLAVNAFSSVSMDPPTILVCVKTTAKSHDHLYAGSHIGVNFLAHNQISVASRFAASGGDKFADIEWSPGSSSVPVLGGAAAHFEIEIEQRLPVGTHTIFIGRVVDADASEMAPLIYFDGAFFDGDELVVAREA